MANHNGLTAKQLKFVDYYIELGNGYQAAVKAGYAPAHCRSYASRLINAHPIVKQMIEDRLEMKSDERIAKQDEVLEFLTKTMRGEVPDQVPLLDGDGYQRLAELDYTQVAHRVKAAELIGKRYTLWTEKQQIEGDVKLEIAIDYGE